MNRLIILALCCVPLLGCGAGTSPHSNYFIVTYRPATPEPTAEGKQALADAVNAATSGSPSGVVIDGPIDAAPGSAEATALVRQRVAAVTQELTRGGVAAGLIHPRLHEVGDQEFAARKDSLIVQVLFGEPPGK